MPNGIDLSCTLNRDYIPAHKKQKLFLKVEITPAKTISESLPLNVCLLIDKSGSMAGTKLENAKKGAINLVQQLISKDYCGIVTFESKAKVVVPGQHVTDPVMFEKKINKIRTGNTTELYEGLRTAFEELKKPLKTQYGQGREPVRRIILLSDGKPTDNKSDSAYAQIAQQIREMGISITALGVGADYNEDLLALIAEESGGVWYHIETPEDIPGLFRRELTSMKTVVYSQPELILNLHTCDLSNMYKATPEVHTVINITHTGNGHRIPMRDITAGETQVFVARIAVPPNPPGKYKIASITLRTGSLKKTVNVSVNYTEDQSLWVDETDPYSRTLFAVTETQVRAKEGLSGDKTALKKAEAQLETIMRDADAAQERDIAQRTTVIGEVLDKTKKGMNKNETKKAKSDLTQIGGG